MDILPNLFPNLKKLIEVNFHIEINTKSKNSFKATNKLNSGTTPQKLKV